METQAKVSEDSDRVLKKTLSSDADNVAVITFGRFQPPHLGHKRMIDIVYKLAKKEIRPEDVDVTGGDVNNNQKIVVAKKFKMEYKSEIERSDPAPAKINMLEELQTSGGFEGDPYVFLSRNKIKLEDKKKLFTPPPRSRSKPMTFEDIMALLNKPSSQLSSNDAKLKEKIKTILGNPLDPDDKLKLMKLQYNAYPDLKLIDPTYFFEEDSEITPNKNIQIGDIVPKLLQNNYNKIVIVIGIDRQDAFDFVAKSAQKAIPPEMQSAELIIVAIGRDLEGTSASKVRLTALNIDIDSYDDPKNDVEKANLTRFLIPEDANDEIKERLRRLLPSFVRKIHEGYKPSPTQSGGRRRRMTQKKRGHRSKVVVDQRQKKALNYRLKRKTMRLTKMKQ